MATRRPDIRLVREEGFTYEIPGVGEMIWNVALAKALIASRYVEEVTLEPSEMQAIAERSSYDEAHLKDVDPAIPGIGAPMIWEGQIIYVLIDGIHRCVRALREQRPFLARLLTDEDARLCVVSAPAGLIP